MLNRLLQLRPAVHAICQLEQALRPYLLSEEDWNLIQRLKGILGIFVKATEHLSGSTYPTLSSQLPYFAILSSRLEKVVYDLRQTDPDSDLCQAVNQAWIKLNQYHRQTTSSQSIATILDPRCKLQTFRHLGWKDEWVTDAHTSFIHIFNQQYSLKTSELQHPSTPDPFEDDKDEDNYADNVFAYESTGPSSSNISEVDLY